MATPLIDYISNVEELLSQIFLDDEWDEEIIDMLEERSRAEEEYKNKVLDRKPNGYCFDCNIKLSSKQVKRCRKCSSERISKEANLKPKVEKITPSNEGKFWTKEMLERVKTLYFTEKKSTKEISKIVGRSKLAIDIKVQELNDPVKKIEITKNDILGL